jgi:hypothetical protein
MQRFSRELILVGRAGGKRSPVGAGIISFFISFYPLAAFPQQSTPSATPAHKIGASQVSRAIDLSVDYLERSCDASGRFAYRVDPNSGGEFSSYNIVRHAGSIYALAAFNRIHPEPTAADTMVRAASFMRTRYMSPDRHSDMLIIWSRPLPRPSEASLGAAGLGLVALGAVRQFRPQTIPLEHLKGLGRFVAFLEKDDGSSASKFNEDTGPESDWESLYYPGEAALGLITLYETDHSREWLILAGKALAHLAKSRANASELPPDHWALIATAKFLPYYNDSACPVPRSDLVSHAARICDRFLREQITSGSDAQLDGGFDRSGRTSPTATRLEGLLAALEFLPADSTNLRSRINSSVERGVEFLLRAQVTSGRFAGGVPRAVLKADSATAKADPRAAEIRIDYVQHALGAWLRYQTLLESRTKGSLRK